MVWVLDTVVLSNSRFFSGSTSKVDLLEVLEDENVFLYVTGNDVFSGTNVFYAVYEPILFVD